MINISFSQIIIIILLSILFFSDFSKIMNTIYMNIKLLKISLKKTFLNKK